MAIGEIASTLASAVDAAGSTARLDEFKKALSTATAKIATTTSDVHGAAVDSWTPATDYQIGVTACKAYTGLTNMATLALDADLEMCSPYATVTVHTKPGEPTCEVATESSTELQLTITKGADDVQTGTFTVSRDDLGYDYLVGFF